MVVQPWLKSMIDAKFNTTHTKDGNSEKAYFCVDCGGESLSKKEMGSAHEGHRIFRAMKNSRRYCYTKVDILSLGSDVLDVSGVCIYSINSTPVYFPKPVTDKYLKHKGILGCCFDCGKPIKKPALFCSILCKLSCNENEEKLETMKLIMEQENLGLSLNKEKKKKKDSKEIMNERRKREEEIMRKETELAKNKGKRMAEEAKLERLVDVVEEKLAESKNLSYRKRSRKGFPIRAPFF